ncbi:MAG: tRNA (adenosine(37)-N6)-dimethylallyltransferase MiaA [Erysipelotrichaceae bacterium]|nr:tRNA (adenosine(37)-N6)-dimethylallyltransferase MiaA [Erysipelotrichaceae bacterium]
MKKVLVIAGPTASGKSGFAVECAKRFNGEIISGDSIQIYRGLDIGSAKIREDEKQGIVHHLIDIKDAGESYSVKEFQELGRELIDDISERGKLPIVAGGTGLYIKALLYDYTFFDEEVKDNPYEELSNQEIYDILSVEDPDSLKKIHVNNRKRLVRALNVLRKHGQGISEIASKQEHKPLYDAFIIGLNRDRSVLYNDINLRVDRMFDEGLENEVRSLVDKGISFDMQSMQGIGYREFRGYFEGAASLDETREMIKKDTRNFAKRQMTWFKNQMDIAWCDDGMKMMETINDWLYNSEK